MLLLLIITILVAALSAGVAVPWRTARRLRTIAPGPADSDPSQVSSAPSIYDRVVSQIRRHPRAPIDYGGFPTIPADQAGTSYRPGARDLLIRESDDARWKKVAQAVFAAGSVKLDDWRALEQIVRDVEPAAYHHKLLRSLHSTSITPDARDLFAEMAQRSSDYTAVKWGIAIGTMGASLPEMESLLPLARHSEFTGYLCHALARGARKVPSYTGLLAELLAVTEGWGLHRTIAYVTQTPELIDTWETQRNCVVFGMRRGDTARGFIAETIVRELDPIALINRAGDDPELGEAMLELLEALVWTSAPPGMFDQMENAERLAERFVDWTATLRTDIDTIRALRSLAILLAHEELGWSGQDALFQRTRALFLESLDPEVIAEAIRADKHREIAMQIIVELGLNDLAPAVLEDLRKRPSALNIDVLGHVGDGDHLQILFELLPSEGSIHERISVARDAVITGDLHNTSAMYAAIIRHMGKLQRADALARVKAAAGDFHPWVRSAAMYAMGTMQRWTLDAESRGLVRACLGDSHEFVRDAARQAAVHHNLHASVNGMAGRPTSEEIGLSLN